MSDVKDKLAGDENTFNPAFNYYRAPTRAICSHCGMEYVEHPVTRVRETRHYGVELYVLCNSDRVKL